MRNRQDIEREMHHAREDLEASLSALRHVVQEKVDVKARARVAVEKGKMAAEDLIVRGMVEAKTLADKGKAAARDVYMKSRETVEERPVLIGSIAAGVIAVGVLIYVGRRRDWF